MSKTVWRWIAERQALYPVLVCGATGAFGSMICRRLAATPRIHVIALARDTTRLCRLRDQVRAESPGSSIEARSACLPDDLPGVLGETRARLVIDATGPFQARDYTLPRLCIEAGAHYLDISDARQHVVGIRSLDTRARSAGVAVISGASSVPGLSSSVVCALSRDLDAVDEIAIGIAPANRTPPGPSTLRAVLSYAGKPIAVRRAGRWTSIHGWQDLRLRRLAVSRAAPLSLRCFCAFEVPDLDLFPEHFPNVQSVSFHAGLELVTLQLGLWLAAWPVRWGWLSSLAPAYPLARRVVEQTRRLGADRGAMFVEVRGRTQTRRWTLVAEAGSGPHVPTLPSVILARKLAWGELTIRGAMPCFNLFTPQEFLDAAADLPIVCETTYVDHETELSFRAASR